MTETSTPITLNQATLYCGDSRDVLPLLQSTQFTACVCDPPYHLTQASRKGSPRNNDPKTPFGRTRLGSKGFMGKTWDGGDVAFRPEFWAEVLRVLKPGAMLLAFGGTRTFHRLTCAIEDAGFEIRDCLMWLYGSGMPKSLDISKSLHKTAGAETAQRWDGWGTSLKPAWESVIVAQKPMAGITAEAKQLLEALKVLEARLWSMLPASVVETHFESGQVDYEKVFAIAQWTVEDSISIQDDLFEEMDTSQYVSVMVTLLNTVSSWRSILGEHCEAMSMSTIAMEPKPTIDWTTLNSCLSEITLQSIIQVETLKPGSKLSALPAARYLNAVCASIVNTRELSAAANAISQDVGLGLRPSYEPIVLAMKPLNGTFAQNAHHYGVAGLNIDGSRIGVGKGGCRDGEKTAEKRYADRGSTNFAPTPGPRGGNAKGRWPANLLFDEEAAVMLDRQSGVLTSGRMPAGTIRQNRSGFTGRTPTLTTRDTPADTGGASRFFYCAKANKRDRTCDGQVENSHPTVKPRSLMEYLCRLVTPPGGGLILDPFMGSGSTGIGAFSTGNRFVGIELEPESFETARRRIEVVSQTISELENTSASA